jgi:hypothetical protein
VRISQDGEALEVLSFESGELYARPDRLLQVGERVYVSLNHVSGDFQDWGEGRFASLRAGDAGWYVEAEHSLEEAKNCGAMALLNDGLSLVCSGAYEEGDPVLASSQALWLDSEGSPQAVLRGDDPRVGGALAPTVAFDGTDLWLVRFGTPGEEGDRVLQWNPLSDEVTLSLEIEVPYAISSLGVLHEGGALIPVGAPVDPRLCRLGAEGWSCAGICAETGLPPRWVLPLGP